MTATANIESPVTEHKSLFHTLVIVIVILLVIGLVWP